MLLDQDDFLNLIRTQLFGNLVHYRQGCINEKEDAKQVARFIEREVISRRSALNPPQQERNHHMDKRLQFRGNREDAERDARRTELNARELEEITRGKIADWRCVDCKFVHHACEEPERCFHCVGRTFARIDGSAQ